MEFRTLVSKEPEKIATIDEESREISIGVDTTRFPVPMGIKNGTQYLKFKSTFNWQMIKIHTEPKGGYYKSLLWVLGMGENTDGVYAARMLKAVDSFIIEMKLANDKFAGFIIDSGGARLFNDRRTSFINEESYEGLDVYSDNVYIS